MPKILRLLFVRENTVPTTVSIKQPLLEVTDLSWSADNKSILNKLTFTLKRGEVLGVIGPNGAGKTSLLRCILQQIKNYQGEIQFDGKNIKSLNRQFIAQHIAVVSQINDPVFKLTVIDVVRMGLLPYKALFSLESKAEQQSIAEALKKTALTTLKNEQFTHLSGGEQQRVLIARALVQKADLLILDEPTNHLDVYYQHQILQLVQSLNLTVLMTIHDLNLANDYCQRLLLLAQGTLIANGSSAQVLQPELLSSVFKLPCRQLTDSNSATSKVYFQPDNAALSALDAKQKTESATHA
jgi:iron complex transport system ATP-binding protein